MAFATPLIEAGELDETVELLGGRGVIARKLQSPLDTHDLLTAGLPVRALEHLINALLILRHSDQTVELAVGISPRSYYRHRKDPTRLLSREQSGRLWKFAEILARASTLLGSQEAAERWLEEPAIGLDQRRPIDLLSTPAGVDTLETHLTRIEYGVYA